MTQSMLECGTIKINFGLRLRVQMKKNYTTLIFQLNTNDLTI